MSDKLIDVSSQYFVFFNGFPGRNGDLQQFDFANHFWMLLEEVLERMQLVRHAFDVVETVTADDKLDVSKLLTKVVHSVLGCIGLESVDKFVRIYTYGKSSRSDLATFEVDSIGRG